MLLLLGCTYSERKEIPLMSINPGKKARAVSLLLLLLVFLVRGASASQIMGCNANGTYKTTYNTRFCTDPVSGLNVHYDLFLTFTWTTPDGVVHSFPISTVRNSSNGYGDGGGVLCGPDDVSTGSAAAFDGSGYFMSVNAYYQATIYDPQGNVVFQFGNGTLCT
jgi:hypothetical protein